VVSALLVVTGCDALAKDEDAARTVAVAFLGAADRGDSRAACGSLAPGTSQELERSEGADCVTALARVGLRAPGAVRRVDVYGRQARVVLAGDTVFLSAFPGGWRVTAAGCAPRPGGQPYQCEIKGG
jgi:hypothetical protein